MDKMIDRCPRCNTKKRQFDNRCGFCQWPWSDRGRQCQRCGYMNKELQHTCKHCKRML